MDKLAMKALVKASRAVEGAGSRSNLGAQAPGRWNRGDTSSHATSGRAAYPSTAPHQGPAPRAALGYTASTRSARATSTHSTHTGKRGLGSRECTGRGARRGATPGLRVESRSAGAGEELEEHQKTFKHVPGPPTCDNRARASRNPYYDFRQCARFVCRRCKLGGHRVNACPN